VLVAVSGAPGSPEQTPKRGGTVIVGTLVEPGCLNAFLHRCASNLPNVGALVELALPGAFRVTPDFAYRPNLVSSVEYSKTRPFTLTYHIRPKARWSDGVPVTARDFVFTDAAVRSVATELWEPEVELYAPVRRVRAVDEKTVEVVLRSRFAGWRGLFPRILPSHALRGSDFSSVWLDRIHDPRTGRAIGSGPFLVSRWERGRSVTFTRNPRYWGHHLAYLDRLVVRFCEQCGAIGSEQLEWMRTGEVDVVQSPVLTGEQVERLRALQSVRVHAGPGASWEHLDIRIGEGGHPALKRKRVRQALAYGIDRVALARALNAQFAARYPPSDSAVFLTNSTYYRPNWGRYRYRPAEARGLLEAEGCRPGPDGIYACDGRRLSLRLATLTGNPRRQQTLEHIQRQLRRAGIEIVPEYTPGQILFNQVLPGGGFDLMLFSYIRFPDFPGNSVGVYGCGGVQNFAGYCQRLVTRDLDQARRILDAARQAQVLNRADAQLSRDVPVIPLFQNPYVVAHRSSVQNIGLAPQLNPFVNADNWWLER
jgi:peptide/nickel transport system substrate-binding protein